MGGEYPKGGRYSWVIRWVIRNLFDVNKIGCWTIDIANIVQRRTLNKHKLEIDTLILVF
jgi:hypothetical protein